MKGKIPDIIVNMNYAWKKCLSCLTIQNLGMKTLKLIALACLFFYKGSSQTAEPIDIQLKLCLDSSQNQTTFGMIACHERAEIAWDKELNKYYKLLMKVLSEGEKLKLKTAQRNWLAFRDSEAGFSYSMYTNMEGTMWKISEAARRMALVRQRAQELRSYYDDRVFVKD
jgi:uncharacterized protein YecT (DUF1311 family)